jgi:hydrogenase expression/formation protein HypD
VKYLDEYRNERIVRSLVARIHERSTRPWVLMEICGGQTHTIMRYGLDELLAGKVELVHGPGCPVCVTPVEIIDKAVELALQTGTILVSYGDMLRVPGSRDDLFHAKAAGADVRVVYSPMDALKIARAHPDKSVVFLAIGFETTAPANAMAAWQARREGLTNFLLLVSHVLVPPAIQLLLQSPENRVQGFIAPGHVCTVVGYHQYERLAADFRVPIVVGGFEPVDILEAILMLVTQLEQRAARAENQYVRSVSRTGNMPAQEMVERVFEVSDQKWRGIGLIPESGLRLRAEFRAHDASRLSAIAALSAEEPAECISAQVLQGIKRPTDCPAFGIRCTPEKPMGAPMVSAEGACAAYFTYRRHGIVIG